MLAIVTNVNVAKNLNLKNTKFFNLYQFLIKNDKTLAFLLHKSFISMNFLFKFL